MRTPLLAGLVMLSVHVQAQGPSSQSALLSAADVFQSAVDAIGGEAALAPKQIAFTFEGTSLAQEQAHDPSEAVVSIPRVDRFWLDHAVARAAFESETTFPGEITFHNLSVFTESGVAQVDLARWRTGTDIARAPAQSAVANLAAIGRYLPHLILQQAMAARATWSLTDGIEIEARPHHGVSYRDAAGTEVTLFFDSATHLLTRFQVQTGSQPAGMVTFGGYSRVDGIMVPSTRLQAVGDNVTQDLRLTFVDLDAHIYDERFTLPDGYEDAPAPGEPVVVAIGDGIFLLDHMRPFRYRSMFVEMEDHVVVLEAPLGAVYAELALDLIRQAVPDKPIRYVLVTHHHGDHVGGVPTLAAEGATVVVGAGVADALRRQFASLEEVAFEVVSDRRTMGEGPARIEILPVPNDHAHGNLAFYMPSAHLLFQGDLFYAPDRGPVPAALPVSEALAEAIRNAGIEVDTIVGVHGRAVTWAEFEAALAARTIALP